MLTRKKLNINSLNQMDQNTLSKKIKTKILKLAKSKYFKF